MGLSGTPEFSVPTIDIREYLLRPGSAAADCVVEQIRAACTTSGFFQLVGHGIPETLQQEAFAAAKALFDLPKEEKYSLRGQPGRGYESIGAQTIEPGKQPDLKEGYFIGREVNHSTVPPRRFQEPNIWPREDQVPELQFKTPLLTYHRAVLQLSSEIMCILASGLKQFDASVITEFCKEPIASLRLLHYPPHPDSKDDTLVGTGAHTDFGAITLLLQDGNSGLQVRNQATGEWLEIAPRKDAYVVNVGDMLEVWTSGVYKSTIHRVINTSGSDRYSMPFFFDGNPDCRIQPLCGLAGNEKGRGFTVEEHMLSRYAASYN